jgi:hypothetical protein
VLEESSNMQINGHKASQEPRRDEPLPWLATTRISLR